MTTTVKRLTDEQVLSLMKADIISQHRLEPEAVDAFLRHPVMRAQIAVLVGVPNFMLMALDALLPQLSTLPVTEEEVRFAFYSLHWLDTPACHLTIAEVPHSTHGWQCSPQNVMWCTTILTDYVHSWCICRQIAGNVMQHYTWCLTIQVGEDLSALSVEFLFNLLLLSLTDVEICRG